MATDDRVSGADADASGDSAQQGARPKVREIGVADIKIALSKGLADFNAKPSHVVFLCLLYPIVAVFVARLTFGYEILSMFFPLLAGFTLIGPLAATGLYEISRRREKGLDSSWRHAFDVFKSPSIGPLAVLGLMLSVLFVVWLMAAQAIYDELFGTVPPASVADFVHQVFATPEGLKLIVAGTSIGFLFAVVVLTISVVSFPLLLDRDVGVATAIRTSVRAVFVNPATMALWGLIVVVTVAIGSLPFFIGLAIVVPVLGHSTWHLYRRVVET